MKGALRTDYLVIGSGIAGMYFALEAAEHGSVLMVTKKAVSDTNTNWAQGGIAAVLSDSDTVEAHVADTLKVGDGLCKADIVQITAEEGPDHVRALSDMGVEFARTSDGEFDLTREAGVQECAHHVL